MPSSILIVDADRAECALLNTILQAGDYRLEMAENGIQALEKARFLQPDVILLDIAIPGMPVTEICQQIRLEARLAEVPIVIMATPEEHQTMVQALDSGADDYLTKPVDSNELHTRLRNLTRLNQYRKALGDRQTIQDDHDQLVKDYDATIEGWSQAMDKRDGESEGHTHRVAEMAILLARAMGLREDDLIHLRRGVLLHDMGELGIPNSILNKPGKLTEQEFELIRKHPVFAHEMFKSVDYLGPALEIPYCHHEKWDGSGYPRGLKGEEIPLSARIFAIVDVWDALISDRPYRPAWTQEEAILFVKDQSSRHFDPHVVEVFLGSVIGIKDLDSIR
jgi:putative two-component system response regulator